MQDSIQAKCQILFYAGQLPRQNFLNLEMQTLYINSGYKYLVFCPVTYHCFVPFLLVIALSLLFLLVLYCLKEEGQTIQLPKEEGQTIQ
jgi:hypothetical protein